MLIRTLMLLLVAATILDLPEAVAQRRQAGVNRTSLFRQQQTRQGEVAIRKKLIGRNRINGARKSTAQPEVTTTETPVVPTATEAPLTDFTDVLNDEVNPTTANPFERNVLSGEPAPLSAPVLLSLNEEDETSQPQFEPVQNIPEPPIRSRFEDEEEPIRPRPRPASIPRPRTVLRPRPVQNEPVAAEDEEPVAKPLIKAAPPAKSRPSKQGERKPVVETVRRYSFESEDGSFTFGYENADGSFKEETRGADCVVRGKYGYIDPDGVKREFTYISGNPCDKNKAQEEDEEESSRESLSEEEEEEERAAPVRRPNLPQRTFINTPRPVIRPSPTPARPSALDFDVSEEEEEEIPRVVEKSRPTSIRLPANPQREQRPVPNPEQVRPPAAPPAPAAPSRSPVPAFDFASEVQRLSGSPAPVPTPTEFPGANIRRPIAPRPSDDERRVEDDERSGQGRPTGSRSFTSELVFDRNSNQFRTAVVQRIPEENRDISIREQLVGFVNPTSTPAPSPRVPIPTASPALPELVRTPAPTPDVEPIAAPTPPLASTSPTSASPAGTFRQPEFDINSFGPSPQEIERIRSEQEQRFRQQEQRRQEDQRRFQEEEQRRRQEEEQRRRQEQERLQQEEQRRLQDEQFRQGFRPQPFPGAAQQPFPGAQQQPFPGPQQPFPGAAPQREQPRGQFGPGPAANFGSAFAFNPSNPGQFRPSFPPQQQPAPFTGRQQFPTAPNPFAPGLNIDQFLRQQQPQQPAAAFGPAQPQQFAPQIAQPQNTANRSQPPVRPLIQSGSNPAAGQIDSFLSGLSG